MLLEDFYTVKETTEVSENETLWNIDLNPEHPVYAGHFPQRAVVPGVCQVQMIKECLCSLQNKEMELVHAKTIKFLAPVLPDEHTHLALRIKVKSNSEEGVSIQAELSDDSNTFCKLSGLFKVLS